MDIVDLQKEVQEDLRINPSALEHELIKTPSLMNKYLRYHYDSKVLIERANSKLSELFLNRMKYYQGLGESYEYKEKPFNYEIKNQKSLEIYLSADEDLTSRKEKLSEFEAVRDYLYEIIQTIKYRNNSIQSMIELRKFESGE